MACLIVIDGPNLGYCYPLGRRTVVAGRDVACPIQIPDEAVSRKHLQIRFDRAHHRYLAADMQSANGVFINEHRMKADSPLHDGDELRVGGTTLIFLKANFPMDAMAIDSDRELIEDRRETVFMPALDSAA